MSPPFVYSTFGLFVDIAFFGSWPPSQYFDKIYFLFVLRYGLFFFDELINQSRDGAAVDASGRLRLGAVGVSHVSQVEWLLGADIVVVVKSEFTAFAALKIFGHCEFLQI